MDFDVIKEMSMRPGGLSFFYTEDEKKFVLWKEFNGMMFRNFQIKEGNEIQDNIFRATYLGNAHRVHAVHPEGSLKDDRAWKRAFTNMYNAMGEIHNRLSEIETLTARRR